MERVFTGGRISSTRLMAATFAVYVAAIVLVQLWFAVDPDRFHEEVRSLFRYHRFGDPALFAGDYLMSFVGSFPQPYLYEGGTRLWLWAGGSLTALHHAMTVVCWLALLLGVGLAGRRLGNWVTALGAAGLVAAQPLYLYQVSSAVPHAFAFPLLAWAVVAMLHGSLTGLVAVTLLSGLLYPAVTPIVGLLLAWQVFVGRDFRQQRNPQRLKGLLMLSVTGALSLWLVFGAMAGKTEDFGAPLAPMQQAEVYPENGPEGRYFFGVTDPVLYVVGKALGQFRTSQEMVALLVLLVCGMVAVYGLATLPKGRAERRVLLGFVLCSLVFAVTVYVVRPYHSYRFVLYPLFTVLPLLTVVGLQNLCGRQKRFLRSPDGAVLAGLALLVLTFDSFDAKKAGYRWDLSSAAREVMDFAAAQPPDSVFAAWPGSENELELLPYLAERPSLVLYKLHYPAYETYTLTMRARMNALVDAYLATEEAPLQVLHCRWNVDYLVVDRAHFAEEGGRPEYFAPFDARIEAIRSTRGRGDFLLANPALSAVVLEAGAYRVVDLAALLGKDCTPSQVD